jgi:hypothetical protein
MGFVISIIVFGCKYTFITSINKGKAKNGENYLEKRKGFVFMLVRLTNSMDADCGCHEI